MERDDMHSVLILSNDNRFRSECAEVLREDGFNSYAVDSEDGVHDFLQGRYGTVDLVIVNATKSNESRNLLDYLAKLKPHVSVLLSCDYFGYWNDFYTWLADRCVVTPSDRSGLKELREAVKQIVSVSGHQEESTDTGRFAVDWS